MGSTWILSAPDGPHVGPMSLAIRDHIPELLNKFPKYLIVWIKTHSLFSISCNIKCYLIDLFSYNVNLICYLYLFMLNKFCLSLILSLYTMNSYTCLTAVDICSSNPSATENDSENCFLDSQCEWVSYEIQQTAIHYMCHECCAIQECGYTSYTVVNNLLKSIISL